VNIHVCVYLLAEVLASSKTDKLFHVSRAACISCVLKLLQIDWS
jgi:hypothetical protein